MFQDQANLDRNGLLKKAQSLQLKKEEFSGCLASEKYKEAVLEDGREAMRAGVTGTPGFRIREDYRTGVGEFGCAALILSPPETGPRESLRPVLESRLSYFWPNGQ